MVNWVTKTLGVKSANSKLKKDEFGTIVVDLRDINDGTNDATTIALVFNRVFSAAALGKNTGTKVILQCEAGISRSCAFIAAIFVRANDMEWDDAIDFVKKKVPQCQINLDLIDSIKEAMERL